MSTQKHIAIVGSGVIGLCTAYYALKRGHHVTILERGGPDRDSCSFGNAGMIVPSHFVPLAAPGMIGFALRMLLNPEGPFAIRPRLDPDLIRWGLLFAGHTTRSHVDRSAPLLRDLNLASRRCYEELAEELAPAQGQLVAAGMRDRQVANRTTAVAEPLATGVASDSSIEIAGFSHNPARTRESSAGRSLSIANAGEKVGQQGAFGLTRNGLLMLCKSARTLEEEAHLADSAHALGLEAQVLTSAETARLDPGIEMDVAGSVYFPTDCHLTPSAFMDRIGAAVRDGGANLSWNSEVVGWRMEGGRIAAARTTLGDFEADEFVVSAGSWSPGTLRELGVRLPMQAGKGYSMTLPRPRQTPALCSILTEARVAVTPMLSGLRFGGTMEVTGLDMSINRRRVKGIVDSAQRYFPAFTAEDFAGAPVWTGLRPCSPDGLPYIGRLGRYPNLSVASGHAMMGMSLGPITGHLMAAILSDQVPEIDIQALSPDRYG